MEKSLETKLRELIDKQEITEVLYRASRGVDRGDIEMMASCFHPDATDHRGVVHGPAENSRNALKTINLAVTHHVTTNVAIELSGDTAKVESYVTAFHHVEEGTDGRGRDELLRARYLDRFERRDGVWKIARRITVWDWSGVWTSLPTWFEQVEKAMDDVRFIYSRRDKKDVYYTDEIPQGF